MNKKEYVGFRPTWAEIDLDALLFNLSQIRRQVGSGVKIMVTVKADAYGHGIVPVASVLALNGVDYFGVASIDEGIVLRKAGIKTPILVLGAILPQDIPPLFEYDLTQSLVSCSLAEELHKAAYKKNKKLKIHIKIDTGMGRLGIWYKDWPAFIKKIKKWPYLQIEGAFTHFPLADTHKDFTLRQIRLFNDLINLLEEKGVHLKFKHAANSMGILGYPHSHFNMVRPGLAIYGISPRDDLDIKLRPVMSLKSKVVFLQRFSSGRRISYGHIYKVKKGATIANIPIGYGDGYPRILSNIGPVLIDGKRFLISGRICMDQLLVDVGRAKVKLGDEVVFIGRQGKESIYAQDLARLCATIPYEIVCGIGARVPRIYLGKAADKIKRQA